MVALSLAGIGLYGVLNYAIHQRRREIGIRMAIGAQAGQIAGRITFDVLFMVTAGALAGIGLGRASVRCIETLLYQVDPIGLRTLVVPSLTILCVALLAALPALFQAVRTDPAEVLRSE